MRFIRFLALLAALALAMPAARAQTAGDRVIGADSSTTALAASAAFTGTSFTTSGAAALCVGVYADVASASGGLSIQQSKDGTNWDLADTFTVSAATAYATTVAVVQPYARVVYTNGGTLQATFRLTTTLRYSGPQLPRTLTQAGSLPVELTAGSATIGKVDQGAPGSGGAAWPVTVTGALPAGTNLLGKVGTDQTTHGTTDKVAADAYVGGAAVSGANALPVTVTGALPAGANSIGTVGLNTGSNIVGRVGIDQTTPGTTDSVSVATGQGAGATIGTTTDAAAAMGGTGTQSAKLREISAQLNGGLPAALSAGGGVKVGVVDALPAGSAIIGKMSTDQTTHGTTDKVAADVYVNGTLASGANALPVTVTGALPAGANSIGTVVLGAGSAIAGKVGIDQTTPGTTDSVSVATGQGAGANIGLTTDAAVGDATGTLNAHARQVAKVLTANLPAPGQGAMAASVPVVIASNQSAINVGLQVASAAVSGSNPVPVTLTSSIPAGSNSIGTVVLGAGTAIAGKFTTDQTTPGTTDLVTVATAQGQGAQIGLTTDAAVGDATGTLNAHTRQVAKVLAGGLPAALSSGGGVKVGVVDALPAGTNEVGAVKQGTAAADSAPWPVRTVEPTVATYRAAFSVVVTGTGDFLEFLGNPTTTARITKITIVKPSAAVGIKVTKRSANDTVGTSTNLTLVPLDSANAASSATIKVYTVAPTQGAAVGDIFPNMSVATTDQYTLDFGATIGQPIVVRNNQSLCLVTDASASTTIMGAIEWTER